MDNKFTNQFHNLYISYLIIYSATIFLCSFFSVGILWILITVYDECWWHFKSLGKCSTFFCQFPPPKKQVKNFNYAVALFNGMKFFSWNKFLHLQLKLCIFEFGILFFYIFFNIENCFHFCSTSVESSF